MTPAALLVCCATLAVSVLPGAARARYAPPAFAPPPGTVSLVSQAGPRVDTVIVHGNHTTPTADVLAMAGDLVGRDATDAFLADVASRLRASGRFSDVEVRRRFVSIDDPHRVLLVIVVNERPGVSDDNLMPGPVARLASGTMWMPMLGYQEGYGFTYGARFSLVDRLGSRTRLSVPLTWGGERQAMVEVERSFAGPAAMRVIGGGGITRRRNPFFDLGDTRQLLWARVEGAPRRWLRAGVDARVANVSFGALDDRFTSIGGTLALDTRREPAFPRNAVFVELGLERLGFDRRAPDGASTARTGTTRRRLDARAYLGLPGQSVLAARVQSVTAPGGVPRYEQQLLGGIPSLRGWDVGSAASDNLAAASLEWRQPLGSPRDLARVGVKGFFDVAAAYAAGDAMSDQHFQRGYGVGVFLQATVFTFDLDMGWKPGRDRPNAHVQFGLRLSSR